MRNGSSVTDTVQSFDPRTGTFLYNPDTQSVSDGNPAIRIHTNENRVLTLDFSDSLRKIPLRLFQREQHESKTFKCRIDIMTNDTYLTVMQDNGHIFRHYYDTINLLKLNGRDVSPQSERAENIFKELMIQTPILLELQVVKVTDDFVDAKVQSVLGEEFDQSNLHPRPQPPGTLRAFLDLVGASDLYFVGASGNNIKTMRFNNPGVAWGDGVTIPLDISPHRVKNPDLFITFSRINRPFGDDTLLRWTIDSTGTPSQLSMEF